MFTTENEIIRSSWKQIYRLVLQHNVKSTVKISSIFVAYLENTIFSREEYLKEKDNIYAGGVFYTKRFTWISIIIS